MIFKWRISINQLGVIFLKHGNFFIGIDIGGTKTYLILERDDKSVVLTKYFTSDNDISKLIAIVKDCLIEAEIEEGDILAMGIGIPGRVDAINGIVIDAPGLKWQNYNIVKAFKEEFSFPIYIDNDVRMALLGEKIRGEHNNVRDMVFICIGTGLGCAILINDIIVSGKDNSAGEIGYFICEKDTEKGKKNQHGNFGTMEAYVSGSALNKKAQRINLSSEELFLQYSDGDERVKEIIDGFLLDLSYLISNIVSLLDPELVVIGGGVSDSMNEFTDIINKTVQGLTPLRTKIIISKLGNSAGMLGASEYGRSKLKIREEYVYEPNRVKA